MASTSGSRVSSATGTKRPYPSVAWRNVTPKTPLESAVKKDSRFVSTKPKSRSKYRHISEAAAHKKKKVKGSLVSCQELSRAEKRSGSPVNLFL